MCLPEVQEVWYIILEPSIKDYPDKGLVGFTASLKPGGFSVVLERSM